MEGSVYIRNILSFIPAEDIDQIKPAFTYRGLKHSGPHPRINNTKTVKYRLLTSGHNSTGRLSWHLISEVQNSVASRMQRVVLKGLKTAIICSEPVTAPVS